MFETLSRPISSLMVRDAMRYFHGKPRWPYQLLKSVHDDWAGEVASWAGPIRIFRGAIEHTAFPSLWGTVVRFDKDRRPSISRPTYPLLVDGPISLILPLDPHLLVLASSLAIRPPDRLHLFPALAVGQ